MSLPSEACNHNLKYSISYFVVIIEEVETAVSGDETGDLLLVLLEEHSDALTDGGVGLFGLHAHLLHHKALRVGSAHEGVLPKRSQ